MNLAKKYEMAYLNLYTVEDEIVSFLEEIGYPVGDCWEDFSFDYYDYSLRFSDCTKVPTEEQINKMKEQGFELIICNPI